METYIFHMSVRPRVCLNICYCFNVYPCMLSVTCGCWYVGACVHARALSMFFQEMISKPGDYESSS